MHSDGDLQEHWKKTISNPNQYNPKSRLYNNNHNHNNNNTPRTATTTTIQSSELILSTREERD